MIDTLINIVHIFVSLVLMFVVLLQQGKGGGMGAAFGGGATSQVFGGRGAGNVLTRATGICAATFMLTSVTLAYRSSSGDRALKAKVAMESKHQEDQGTPRPKDEGAKPPPSQASDPGAPASTANEPAPSPEPEGPKSTEAPAPAPNP